MFQNGGNSFKQWSTCGGCNCCSSQCVPSCGAAGNPTGCDDADCTAAICAADSFCCNTGWDATCVQEVDQFGCGNCGGGTASGLEKTRPSPGGVSVSMSTTLDGLCPGVNKLVTYPGIGQ